MTAAPFDGSAYRRNVLATLRDKSPSEVDDLFWLAVVPRDADDDGAIADMLQAARGFLYKERTRARQAAVAQAVLNEWPRVEATLLDPAERAALRRRLESHQSAAPAPADGAPRPKRAAPVSPGDRRRRQANAALTELARLRDDPDLAADLYAFLGLPVSATHEMLSARIEKIAEINRRRRPDRERTLVDDLLAHSRKLLLEGDPGEYLAGFDDEAREAVVDAVLSGDVAAARSALGTAHARGIADSAIVARVSALAPTVPGPLALSPLGLGTWCPACGSVAPGGAASCPTCGTGLQLRCGSCQQLAAADSPTCPHCNASLDEQRAPLLARRAALTAEAEALAEAEAAPPAELQERLRALQRAHPDWQQVARRLAALPPAPPRDVRVAVELNEALITWAPPPGEAPDAYLVERHRPDGSRVLGRTPLLEFSDAAPRTPGVSWTVRALRGSSASSAPVTATPPQAGDPPPPEPETPAPPERAGVRDLTARGGRPVVLSWQAPPDAQLVLTRVRGDVRRTIRPDQDGYVDRKVELGATYEYTVAIDGVEGSATSITVTVDGNAAPEPPAADNAPPSVSEVVVRRREDGRVEATWSWPAGTTEVFVAWGDAPPASALDAGGGRKITNTRYEIDGGATLDGVPAGAHIAVFTGSRSATGQLVWSVEAPPAARSLVP